MEYAVEETGAEVCRDRNQMIQKVTARFADY